MFKKVLSVFFLIIGILAVFNIGFFVGNYWGSSETAKLYPPQEIDFSLFWKAYHTLQEKFVNSKEFDNQQVMYGAISGMTQSLDDPYTTFLDPKDTEEFLKDMEGEYEGIGVEIGMKKNRLTVVAPLEGTPGQEVGLMAGDKILEIDGVSTDDMSIEKAITLIRGEKGTKVVLTILREQWENSRKMEIKRETIKIPSLKLEFKPEGVAYLRIYHFIEPTSSDFRKAAEEILGKGSQKMILDLRNNPGGYLEVVQDIAGWFLEKGQTVVIEDFGQGETEKKYKAKGNSIFKDWPIVILMNKGSASGAEILAGALRDNRGVKLIGETSFGKGSVQELTKLQGGSSLKITVAKWLTPNKELINEKGLAPDIEIEMTKEDYEEKKDPQLDKAIEIIKELK